MTEEEKEKARKLAMMVKEARDMVKDYFADDGVDIAFPKLLEMEMGVRGQVITYELKITRDKSIWIPYGSDADRIVIDYTQEEEW